MRHLVVMGVAGAGKSTVAAGLARRAGLPFAEGDTFHPPANVARMTAGLPLDDADRAPWLAALRDWTAAREAAGEASVLSCSALRRVYRDVLRAAGGDVVHVHLALPRGDLADRLARRAGHFMPPALLDSQLAVLEPLAPDERGVTVEATGDPDQVLALVLGALAELPPAPSPA